MRRLTIRPRSRGTAAVFGLGIAVSLAVVVAAGDDRRPHGGSPWPGPPQLAPTSPPPANSAAERNLRAMETRLLGPAHAAEHAIAREFARRQARTGDEPASPKPPLLRGASLGTGLAAAPAAAAVAPDPALVGRWIPKFAIPSVAVHAVMLPTGKILYFTGPTTGHAYLLDPVTHATENVDPPPLPGQTTPANIFCAGQSFLADGRVLIVGGTVDRRVGLNTIFTFDPFTKTWDRHPNMRHGRWYPSEVLLADGRTAILDGLDERGEPFTNPDLEVYDPSHETVSLAAVRGTQDEPPVGGLYPHLFVMPSGRVLVAGPQRQDSWFFEPGPAGGLTWQDAPDITIRRTWASGVLMPGGADGSSKVALIGGADKDALPDSGTSTPLASTEIFDERTPNSGWTPGPSLNVARAHQNTVLLPDGSMATVGGGYGILNGNRRTGDPALHRQVELYDPAGNSWRLGSSQDELRTYHSTALLLPDARVLSAGDDVNGGTDTDTAEIYEPPYLFKGPRPTIDSAPAAVGHGATFTVATHDQVTGAVLVAPGAATHAVDMSQRYVALELSQRMDGQGVDLAAPSSPNVAPPGYYMLFLLNEKGVPSVAKFIRLRIPPKPASIEIEPAAPLTRDEVTLSVKAGEGGVTISGVEWDLDEDGSFDDGASNPIKATFESPGSHVARARITYDTGLSTISERVLTIGNRPPTATISFAPPAPLSLEPVNFAVSAADPDSAIAARQWDLDDDGNFDDASGPTAARAFPRNGSYVVQARVSDELGASITARATVTVANRSPVATFNYSPAHPIPLEEIAFTSTSSDLDGTVASVQWDMSGDGSFDDATGIVATRAFAASGVYTVGLRVTDNDGGVSTASQSITVSNGPAAVSPPSDISQPLGVSPASPAGGAQGNPSPSKAVLSRKRATSKAESALKRRYGRAYRRAARRLLSCARRSAAAFRCRYSFLSKGARRSGVVDVELKDSRVTAHVRPHARSS